MALTTEIASEYGKLLPVNAGQITLTKNCCGKIQLQWGAISQEFTIPPPDSAVICINYRNNLCWAPINDTSGGFLERYKNHISDFISTNYKVKEVLSAKPFSEALMIDMYNMHDIDTRKKIIKRANAEEKKQLIRKNICSLCYKYSTNGIETCIHIDCPGCCKECKTIPLFRRVINDIDKPGDENKSFHQRLVEICVACKKEQKLRCPICLEDKVLNDICIIGCKHAFCYKCYCEGSIKGYPIMKCPQCRGPVQLA